MIRILGILFIVLYMAYMYFIGGAFTNKEGSYSYQFIVGYMIFSFCVALGGIIIQVLNLSWWFFVIYLAAVYGGLAFVALGKMATNRTPLFQPSKVKDFFSEQWFLIIVSILLTIFAVSHLLWIWGNNSSDDGYYLSLVGALPYSPNSFHMSPSTGFTVSLKGVGSYVINTIYSEYSVYAFFTRMKASLFCRVYMTFFNYFLYGSCIIAFAEKIIKQLKMNVSKSLLQFSTTIMLLFGFTMGFMVSHRLMDVYDLWQYNTAMYYGSSIVRMMTFFWVLIPFFDKDKITSREVIIVGGIGLALLSKSTIALPLMIIVPIAYVLTYWSISNKPMNWLYSILLILGYLTISIVLGNNDSIQNMVIEYWDKIKNSILLIPSILIILLSCFTRNKYIIRYNLTLLLVLVFMIFSPINNVFEKTSVMSFVACRALASWYYTLVATAFVYLTIGIYYVARVDVVRKAILMTIAALICLYLPLSDNANYSEFFSKLKVLSQNPDCIPASTTSLGDVLEQRYQETGQLNVAAITEGAKPNGLLHYPNTIIRSLSPHTISLSAVSRFGSDNYDIYQAYTKETQNNFNYFIGNPTDDTYNVIANALDDAHCNMIVMNSEVGLNGYSYVPFLSRSGFELYKVIEDPAANVQYFVYTRNI